MHSANSDLVIEPCTDKRGLNSLQNDKILEWSKLKGFADNKIYLNETLKFVFGRVENVAEKEENAGYQGL